MLGQSDRNKHIIDVLSAPGYHLAINSRQCLKWETVLGNAIIDNMENNNFIPVDMVKGVLPCFHLDNIDFTEDTADGKHNMHALQLSVFQKRTRDCSQFILDVNQKNVSLKLKSNSFNELLPCSKAKVSMFHRTSGCTNSMQHGVTVSQNLKNWLLMKAMEVLHLKSTIISG